MKPEMNGKRSSTQRARRLNIKFFCVTDRIEKGWPKAKRCSTDGTVADFLTKPLHGEKFRKLRARIMNCPVDLEPADMPLTPAGDEAQECVERRGVSWADRVRQGG